MIPQSRIPAHPGVILSEEFLKPLGITQVELAARIGTPTQRVNEIVKGKRGITPETAWLFSQAFGTSPQFWLNLQSNRDLAVSKPKRRIKQFNLPQVHECV
jgi:addiction module HigA family antidote